MAKAAREAGDPCGAIELIRLGLEIDPEHVASLSDLGTSLVALGFARLAIPLFEAVIKLKPQLASLHIELGNAFYLVDETDRALECHRRAQQLQPIRSITGREEGHLGFTVLISDGSGVGNTPSQFLLSDAAFDCHFFSIVRETAPDVELLRRYGNVVLNLISDVDQGRDPLSRASQPAISSMKTSSSQL